MTLRDIYDHVYNTLLPTAYDGIPNDFDFKNGIAIDVKIGESIINKHDLDDITLQIRIVGLLERKMAIVEQGEQIDGLVNDHHFGSCYIVREDPYLVTYEDGDKFNVVLQYIIKNFKY